MEVRSEKVFYENDVLDAFRNKDVDIILWGEELYDAKIVVYPKKIKAAPGYSDFSYRLIDAGLVYFNYRQKDFIKSKVVRWDPEKRIMYIPEAEFNNFWKFLKGSINLGIKIYGGNEDFPITRAEDIVDLSMMKKPGSEGIIEKNEIKHISKQLSEEERRVIGRKQSALDNRKNMFFYSDQGESYHDRECEEVKLIQPEHFMFSETMPEELKPCRRCKRRLALRKACDPYVKQIGTVDQMLKRQDIKDAPVFKYAFEYGLKFRVDEEGELTVTGSEDTWIVKGFDSGSLSLWHNNYVRTAPRERYITTGFHNQGMDGKSLYLMLETINSYTFEKHLEAEEKVEQTSLDKEEYEKEEPKSTDIPYKDVQSIIYRIMEFLKRFFEKIRNM